MLERRSLLPKIGRGLLRVSDPVAHGLIVRELDTWVRLEFLGVMARSGVADALKEPATLEDVTDRTGIQDQQLLEALLALGLSLRELRIRRGRYSIRGRRMRAIVGSSPICEAWSRSWSSTTTLSTPGSCPIFTVRRLRRTTPASGM